MKLTRKQLVQHLEKESTKKIRRKATIRVRGKTSKELKK